MVHSGALSRKTETPSGVAEGWRSALRRIAIVGSAGAGKSTLARQIGEITELAVVQLDAIYWRPGWVPIPDEEWDAVVKDVASRESWIIRGNYGRTMETRLERADAILFLDFPRLVCLWRVFKRWLRYRGKTRPDLAPGCPEQLDREFVRWIWGYPKRSRPGVIERIERHSTDTEVIALRSQREIDEFMETMTEE